MRDFLGSSRRAIALISRPALVAVMLLVGARVEAKENLADVQQAEPASIVCLRTEYLPLQEATPGLLKYRIVRELGRQAVLMTARDELGLATRDETLGEKFPESVTAAKRDFQVKVRGFMDGHVWVRFWPASSEPDPAPEPHELQGFSGYALALMTDKLEEMSRGEFPEAFGKAGIKGQAKPAYEENVPPESIEDLLLEMNFISQFAAVRAAHAAIAEEGESRGWLGVLVRGYAHLALLTQHHWKSDTEAFAARALLYAERLATANANDPLSRAHRAYARAIVGLHGAALIELDEVEKLQANAEGAAALPGWYDLIRPYCSFQRERVTSLGDRRASLRQLAQRLSFEQHRAYGDDRWLFESARQTMSVCPDDYSVYAALAVPGTPLAVGRTGAFYAPAAMAHFLPGRVARLAVLPENVRVLFKGEDASEASGSEAEVDEEADGENASGEEAEVADGEESPAVDEDAEEENESPISLIVNALREASENGDDRDEPSWSVLGEMIFEEQFVQAANYLNISLNATESSQADVVAAILPEIKGHRYERHIESYAVNASRERERVYEIVGDMQIIDPRGNMQAMMGRIWRAPAENGRNSRGSDASYYAFYDIGLTMPAMMEAYNRRTSVWWSSMDEFFRKRWLEGYRAVSPHAPQTLRLAVDMAEERPYEQLVQWESEAGEDPAIFFRLAHLYLELERYEDAIRCFERSIELSPHKDTFVALAQTYRDSGQAELWLPTLERFFEVESLGLEHASVHRLIANDFIAQGKWEEAEEHALEAANTWSAWGLQLASVVYEGLGRLDESEKWIREMSESYPSSSGHHWYFWCRRHGQGDAEAALKLAEVRCSAAWMRTNDEGRRTLCAFHLLKGDSPAALEDAKYLFDRYQHESASLQNRAFFDMQLALAARDSKDEPIEKQALESARRTSKALRELDPDLSAIVEFECNLADGELAADADLEEIDKRLGSEALPEPRRCNHEYFVGRLYELAGQPETAKKFYERSMRHFRENPETATVAGMRLAELKKRSPEIDAADGKTAPDADGAPEAEERDAVPESEE